MTRLRFALSIFVFAVGAVLLAACSSPEIRFRSDEFPFETVRNHRIALGGLIAGARLSVEAEGADSELLPTAVFDQADRWSHHLATELLVQAPELDIWHWATVADEADPALLEGLLRNHAAGGILKPQDLAAVAADLPGCRFLLLTRIDSNETHLDSHDPVSQEARLNQAGLGKPAGDGDVATPGGSLHSLRRTVGLTLDLYDLDSGRSLWSASVERSRSDGLDSESANADAVVRVEKDPGTADGILISGGSRLTGGPSLDDVLPAACSALVTDFLALTEPADEISGD